LFVFRVKFIVRGSVPVRVIGTVWVQFSLGFSVSTHVGFGFCLGLGFRSV